MDKTSGTQCTEACTAWPFKSVELRIKKNDERKEFRQENYDYVLYV